MISALNEIDRKADLSAVEAAITAIYRPWLDAVAKALQAAVGPVNAGTYVHRLPRNLWPAKSSYSSMDFDSSRASSGRSAGRRRSRPDLATGLAALPTVTQTSKPALVPVDQSLFAAGSRLDARRASEGPQRRRPGAARPHGNSEHPGPSRATTGDPSGVAWTEAGEIDHRGHDVGVRLVDYLDDEVERIVGRIEELLDAGWTRSPSSPTTDGSFFLAAWRRTRICLPPLPRSRRAAAPVLRTARLIVPTVPWYWDPRRTHRARAWSLLLRGQPRLRAWRSEPAGVHRSAALRDSRSDRLRWQRVSRGEVARPDAAGRVQWLRRWADH